MLPFALAMIIGTVPMALGLGEGGEQNAPLGRAVIGGLLCATACRSVADMERRHPAGHVARHERALSPGLTDASSLLLAPQIPW
jgi:hypothetical protein